MATKEELKLQMRPQAYQEWLHRCRVERLLTEILATLKVIAEKST